MKKVLVTLCLLAISTGVANARPIAPQPVHHKQPAPMQKVVPPPKPMPVVYQPVQVPAGYYGYSNPSVTFSVGNVDVTLGL